MEVSLWHAVTYRDTAGRYGFAERTETTKHLTQRTWTRVGAIYTFWGTRASAFLNAGIAEDADPLPAFRLGGGLRLRPEFPLMLHGYNIEEIFARRFWLVNLDLSVSALAGPGSGAPPAPGRTTPGSTTSGARACPAPASPASAPTCRSPSRKASHWSWDMVTASMRRATIVSAATDIDTQLEFKY